MQFTKMEALGNDYVYVNCFCEEVKEPEKLAATVSDRHKGIGADGLILICPSEKADARMRIFNADGSEAEMCGNGIRCVAKYVYEHNLSSGGGAFEVPGGRVYPESVKIETGNGVLQLGLVIDDAGNVDEVCVNMGEPILRPEDIPVRLPGERVVEQGVEIRGQKLPATCVSMGNPHAVFFTENVEEVELEKLGPIIENHKFFPNRTNVHFAEVAGRGELKVRTWERGSGITLACGTGACACCVAGVLAGYTERECICHLAGGDLSLNWCEEDNCVYMTGPAVEVFEGTFRCKADC